MHQNIIVIGATGKVGREFLRQVAECDVPELKKHRNPTVVVGLADSRHAAIARGGFSKEVLERFVRTKQRVGDVLGATRHSSEGIFALADSMNLLGFDGRGTVYVDVTSETDIARDFHLRIMRATGSQMATANKNPLSRYGFDVYKTLTTDPTRYQYSATTMAGLGAVPWLSERHTIQDDVHNIDASLSGTLGFITSALMKGEKLSGAIRAAREEGYTEPDYRDDLNGVDVARKLIILAREAGYAVEFEDIHVEPFLPKEYLDILDPEECLEKIERELDTIMSDRYAQAAARGMTLKYLASFTNNNGGPILKVRLEEVPFDSAFGRLVGTDNRIEVVTDMYSKNRPYKLEGPGAGLNLTASILRRDLLRLQSEIQRF